MRTISTYLDSLIDIHITAGIQIRYIVMNISQLKYFTPNSKDRNLIESFKPTQNKDHMIATSVFGSWSGIELRYSSDVEEGLIYAVSDEKKY